MYHPVPCPSSPERRSAGRSGSTEEVNRKYLGEAFQPRGFSRQRCATTGGWQRSLKKRGFPRIIADELSYNGHLARIAPGRTYSVKGLGGFGIFSKSGNTVQPFTYGKYRNLEEFLADLDPGYHRRETYLLTGTDGRSTATTTRDWKIFWLKPSGIRRLKPVPFRSCRSLPRPGGSGDPLPLPGVPGRMSWKQGSLIPSGTFPATNSMSSSGA